MFSVDVSHGHASQIIISVVLLLILPVPLLGQVLSPLNFLAGDTLVEASPGTQDWPDVAAGGPGYFVVWDDKRPVLETIGTTPTGVAFQGNGYDIYGALLDAQGNVIDSPIVIANQGRNQRRPKVAWNGESFLVVWVSERPDWYFFQDVMGIRVSASGELLDPEPFVIRPQNDVPFQPNDYAENPAIASDGTNWIVVWEDQDWTQSSGNPNIAGKRIAPDGTIIDPDPVVIYQQPTFAFAPKVPDIAFAGDEFLVVWDKSGIVGRRVDLNLQPLGSEFTINQFSSEPRVASNGTDFLVVDAQYKAFRVLHDGTLLDGTGIDFDAGGQMSQPSGPDVAWDGTQYVIAFGSGINSFVDSDLYTAAIGSDGSLVGPDIALQTSDFEWKAAVAGGGGGVAQVIVTTRDDLIPEDVRGFQTRPGGVISETEEISTGLHRQAYLRFASNGDEHLAVFLSDGGGLRRVMAQRLDSTGAAIDTEPTQLTAVSEFRKVEFDVDFNGTYFFVTWADEAGNVLGQRLAADGRLVDSGPMTLVPGAGATGHIAVGALNDTFLVVYSIRESGDLQYFRAVRVRGTDLAVLDSPFYAAFNFAKDPRVTALGNRWLLVWENQTRHDQSSSGADGKFIQADGTVGATFEFNSGWGDDPDVSAAGDRALVVWWDTTTISNTLLKGRIIREDGSFMTGEFEIADANNDQRQPAVGWDGDQFVVAWMDFRGVFGVEHERADIYAARVLPDGTVLDPGGFPLTNSLLPEELPDVSGSGGSSLIGFSMLHGTVDPEVQRIAYRVLSTSTVPSDFAVTHGTYASGSTADLTSSDDQDLVVFRNRLDIQSRTQFEITAISPLANPATLDVTLEGSVFARTAVVQKIELYDYVSSEWLLIDSRPASRFTDTTVRIAVPGDVSAFVEPGTLNVTARITYESNPRQQFSSSTDLFSWTFGD